MPVLSVKNPLAIGPFINENGDIMSGDLDMGNNDIDNIGHITFDLAHTGAVGVGHLHWNTADGTLEVGALGGNVVLQIGQESHVYVVQKTGSPILNGKTVISIGTSGERMEVGLTDLTTPGRVGSLGMTTEDIANNQQGYVTTVGLVRNIDTSSWLEGALLFADGTTPGDLTNIPPTAPLSKVFVGVVIRSHAVNGSMYITPVSVQVLSSLSDVYNVALAAGTILYWNDGNSRFEFDSVLTVSNVLAAVNGDLVVGGTTKQTNATKLQIESGLTAKEDAGVPTADTGYWKLYSLADNKLYFQDGDGVSHELATV